MFCINIQVWGYGFASDEVFCAPFLGVFVVFLIVFSFFSCLSVGPGGTVFKATVLPVPSYGDLSCRYGYSLLP